MTKRKPADQLPIRIKLDGRMTADLFREYFSYDPEMGIFTRKKRYWGKPAGEVVGSVAKITGRTYWVICVFNRKYYAHQLAWLYMTGEWPPRIVDHRDNDGLNNKWSNLRLATQSQNQQNCGLHRDSTTGFKGVRRAGKRFQALIRLNGKSRHLGCFDTPEQAAEAYRIAAARHYGEFARASLPAPPTPPGKEGQP